MSESPVVHDMELRDIEGVLKNKLGDKLAVIACETEPLIPFGENYCSTILKVRALVKEEPEAETKELNLVAKMMPPTDYQRQLFDSRFTFRKETFFYRDLLPAYQQLEREFGVGSDRLFDNAPLFYGARYTKLDDRDHDEKVDDDAVILMQNLKVLGYYTVDRFKGMDESHARKSIATMARFHALGMAMKQHKPDFFETIKRHSKCLQFEVDDDELAEIDAFLGILSNDPTTAPYYRDVQASMRQDLHEVWEAPPEEPWSTIVHMDLWVNNIMFRKDAESGDILDVKFVDFQNYLFMSPLRDLVFFLMMNFDEDVMENQFDGLLDLYYDTFMANLEKMQCDTAPFVRDKFDEQLKKDAFLEFPHCPFMTKIMTTEPKPDANIDDIEEVLKGTDFAPLFMERIRMYVSKYARMGWFSKK